jgi:hypothetical protein
VLRFCSVLTAVRCVPGIVHEKDGFAEWGNFFLYLLLDAPGEVGRGGVAANEASLIKTGVESIGDLTWVRVDWLNLALCHD